VNTWHRSQTRFARGYHLSGLQPAKKHRLVARLDALFAFNPTFLAQVFRGEL
jgi:hypothetical protein